MYDTDFTAREVALTFVWSRMRVIDEDLLTSRVKLIQLSFTDFLEAIVRLALTKALPTDEEIFEYDCEDAGEMLLKMRSVDPALYQSFIAQNSPKFGEPPRQGVFRLVEHLCHLIMRTIAGIVASGGDERKSVKDMQEMTLDNVRLFQRLARRGGGPKG